MKTIQIFLIIIFSALLGFKVSAQTSEPCEKGRLYFQGTSIYNTDNNSNRKKVYTLPELEKFTSRKGHNIQNEYKNVYFLNLGNCKYGFTFRKSYREKYISKRTYEQIKNMEKASFPWDYKKTYDPDSEISLNSFALKFPESGEIYNFYFVDYFEIDFSGNISFKNRAFYIEIQYDNKEIPMEKECEAVKLKLLNLGYSYLGEGYINTKTFRLAKDSERNQKTYKGE